MAEPGTLSLEEFKARLPLAEIIGRHVRLVRRGRELQGLCPFHGEKTPSFTVSEAKGFYHCFGCGQHGNAIDFVMAIEGLDFGQAVQRLADLTGLPAPGRALAPRIDRSLYAANEAAARWFAGRLASPAGTEAAAYLARRGLDQDLIERFGLGYAPAERTALRRALNAEGYGDAALVEVGLLIRPEDGGQPYDRFRDRVMFPIHDGRGRIVGFGGRALGDAKAKYLNTPDTALFHKGELLYGLPLARSAARAAGTILVAEGYMDVIALARAGLPHAVAPLGTAITEAQLALLWQLADEPQVCLDGDEAGLRAGHRLIERALPLLKPGKSLRFVLLPRGADPDDLVRAGKAASLRELVAQAQPLLDFLWASEVRQRSLDTPERRAALRARLTELVRTIADRDVQGAFREALFGLWRARLGGSARQQRRGAQATAAPANDRGTGAARLASRLGSIAAAAERELLAPVLARPALLAGIEEELALLELADPTLDRLRQAIISWYSEEGHLDPAGLRNHLCKHGFASLVEQLSVAGPTAWYGRSDITTAEMLDGWRARVAQRRSYQAEREGREAVAEAIALARGDEARVQRLAVDRLLNQRTTRRTVRNGGG
jgi:DNA primase